MKPSAVLPVPIRCSSIFYIRSLIVICAYVCAVEEMVYDVCVGVAEEV